MHLAGRQGGSLSVCLFGRLAGWQGGRVAGWQAGRRAFKSDPELS
jgi:hypothetical protein